MNRMLLGLVGRDETDTVAVVESMPGRQEDTWRLRIAAVFIILSAGLFGGVPPLFVKALQNQVGLPTFLIRAFSAGVILALALVHILPDAIEELVDLGGVDYPLGGTCVLVGLFVMVFIDHGAHVMYNMPYVHTHNGGSPNHSHGRGPLVQPGARAHDCSNHSHSHGHREPCCGPGASIGEPLLTLEASESGGEDADAGGFVGAPCEGGSDGKQPEDDCRLQLHGQNQHQEHRSQFEQQLQVAEVEKGLGAHSDTAATLSCADGDLFARQAARPGPGPLQEAAILDTAPPAPSRSGTCIPLKTENGTGCREAKRDTASKGGGQLEARSCASTPSLDGAAPATATAAVAVAVAVGGNAAANATCQSHAALFERPSDHCHDCVSRASAPNFATAVEVSSETGSSLRLRIAAYLFELGCIFHSFIIGLSLGVNRTSVAQVRALLIALSFHQALEGLSLASVINSSGFSIAKAAAMVATYSVTCPLGVAVGIAIAATYDQDSTSAHAAQGCLNGISGGMLLYISLVQLIAEDMGKYLLGPQPSDGTGSSLHGPAGLPCSHAHGGGGGGNGGGGIGCRIRLPSFLAFCLGAASMCLLAVWA